MAIDARVRADADLFDVDEIAYDAWSRLPQARSSARATRRSPRSGSTLSTRPIGREPASVRAIVVSDDQR
jgi:hypothetical protein